jgi:hypothetical protein
VPDPEPPRPVPTPEPPTPEPPDEPLPPAAQTPASGGLTRRSKLSWLRSFFLGDPELDDEPLLESIEPSELDFEPESELVPDLAPEPEPTRVADPQPELSPALTAALNSLGQAHHRPFSRA